MAPEAGRLALEERVLRLLGRLLQEGRLVGQRFVDDGAETEEVALGLDDLPLRLLR